MIELVKYLPTLFVLVVAVWLVTKAWLLARSPIDVAALEQQLTADITSRAAVGEWPDWASYRDAVLRNSLAVSERLRLYASVALALGLVGTVGYFILEGLSPAPQVSTMAVARQLQLSLPRSLVGPLIGVLAHLTIVVLLDRFEGKHERAGEALLGRLEAFARLHRPEQTLAAALRAEIQGFQATLSSELVAALRHALQDFPQAAQTFAAQMSGFSATIEAQRHLITSAAGGLELAVNSLRPVAEQMSGLGERIARLPADLGAVVDKFEASTHDRERALAGIVTQTREEVAKLPATLEAALVAGATRIADKLGQDTTFYAANLRTTLEEDHRRLLAQHELLRNEIREIERDWRRNVGEIVRGVANSTTDAVEAQIAPALRAASAELQQSAQDASGRLGEMATLQAQLVGQLAGIVASWKDVADDAEKAASAFQQLRASLDSTAREFQDLTNGLAALPAGLAAVPQQVSAGIESLLASERQLAEALVTRAERLLANLDARYQQLHAALAAESALARELLGALTESLLPELQQGAR